MRRSQNNNQKQNPYLLSLAALGFSAFLTVIYLVIDPSTTSRWLLLLLALIPNLIAALIIFILVFLFIYLPGVNASLEQPIPKVDTQRLARELTTKLTDVVRQIPISDATTQKLVKEFLKELQPILSRVEVIGSRQMSQGTLLQKHTANIIRQSHLMVSNVRSDLHKRFQDKTGRNSATTIQVEDFELFQNICRWITDNTRTALLEYFRANNIEIGEDVAITIKLLLPTSKLEEIYNLSEYQRSKVRTKDQWIITVFRDSYTYNHFHDEREVGAIIYYTIEGNTAFKSIHNGDGFFRQNNLKNQHTQGRYDNENPEWQKHYNSTLVVPIQYHDKRTNRREFYGFLAADSKNTISRELYDEDICLSIMKHGAELLTTFFLILAINYSANGDVDNNNSPTLP